MRITFCSFTRENPRGGGGGGGALRFFFDGGVPQPTMKWGSKERTTRVKYRVLGTTELSGRVKKWGLGNGCDVCIESPYTLYGRVLLVCVD